MSDGEYWTPVDSWTSPPNQPHCIRTTYEHALPDGSVLVLVRCADNHTESCAMTHVHAQPRREPFR